MIFECCKWDPQVGDQAALCRFPLFISREEWSHLVRLAENLAAETMGCEDELLRRPALWARLGLPRAILRALAGIERDGLPRAAVRVVRFDFHLCQGGWRISEANTDVPGGFVEGTGLSRLMAEQYPGCIPVGDPAGEYADAIADLAAKSGAVAMIHATAYADDRQVMAFLARSLSDRSVKPILASPAHLRWSGGRASLLTGAGATSLAAIVRFFPGEWLPNLPRACEWRLLLAGSQTPLSNPATVLVTQSKRLPLVWDQLETPLPAWRALLPETRSPAEVMWQRDDSWILKPALGRVGEGVGLRGVSTPKEWKQIAAAATRYPHDWIAQRRFDALPIATPDGPRYPVLGVFTVDGRAAGIYGRIASHPLIDHRAQDVAVLFAEEESP
jgi:glutathionylspermidine synthase